MSFGWPEVLFWSGEVLLGVVLLGEVLPCGLLLLGVVAPLVAPAPLPVTVIRLLTLRLPAYDWAMRSAVCFSFPVATLPERSTLMSVTITLMLSLASVASLPIED